MSRGRIPNVNASLIHEARMLFQQFLMGRQENRYAMRVTQAHSAPECKHAVLKCSFCEDAPKDATVVINGYSACVLHETKARSATNTPNFS